MKIPLYHAIYDRSGVEEVDEREIFEGSENSLTMNQTYTHEFRCLYDLEKYPFDRQVCSIDMTTTNLDAPTMRLVPNHLWVEQSADMTLFFMEGWDFDYKDKKALGKGIRMRIFLNFATARLIRFVLSSPSKMPIISRIFL